MTLRDWFAGQALLGMCGNETWVQEVRDYVENDGLKGHKLNARVAYFAADAMLEARKNYETH